MIIFPTYLIIWDDCIFSSLFSSSTEEHLRCLLRIFSLRHGTRLKVWVTTFEKQSGAGSEFSGASARCKKSRPCRGSPDTCSGSHRNLLLVADSCDTSLLRHRSKIGEYCVSYSFVSVLGLSMMCLLMLFTMFLLRRSSHTVNVIWYDQSIKSSIDLVKNVFVWAKTVTTLTKNFPPNTCLYQAWHRTVVVVLPRSNNSTCTYCTSLRIFRNFCLCPFLGSCLSLSLSFSAPLSLLDPC